MLESNLGIFFEMKISVKKPVVLALPPIMNLRFKADSSKNEPTQRKSTRHAVRRTRTGDRSVTAEDPEGCESNRQTILLV